MLSETVTAMSENDSDSGLQVRTYFVRGRNALIARCDFGELYVDYYLHQGQHGYQHRPAHDDMLKRALAAVTLHLASRPWNESCAWTIHFADSLVNLFVTGDNRRGAIVGQLFTENVKDDGQSVFMADTLRERYDPRRSVVEFETPDVFRAVEEYYLQSEQRPARLFQHSEEDFVLVAAHPDCDTTWFDALTDEDIRYLDTRETLSLLETRNYRWDCGCNDQRMLQVLAPIMRSQPEELFGDTSTLRMSCPRCGARFVVTRETMEAYMEDAARRNRE